jgi:hypothetical protein
MPFLQAPFQYDAFVSYSHGARPGQTDTPLKRWTLELINNLEQNVWSVDPELQHVTIWRDAHHDPTLFLTDEIRRTVSASGILILVMSPWYLASKWCTDEREWFKEQVQDRSRDQGRVFVIRALHTDEKNWPDFLRDTRGHALPGFKFYDKEDSVPHGWEGNYGEPKIYQQELQRLRVTLTKRLRELRANAERRVAAEAPPAAAAAAATSRRRIYLHARPEHQPVNESIRRKLEEDGILPLCPAGDAGRDLADLLRKSKARMEAAKRCDAIALVRADGDDSFVGDLIEVGVDERERIETSRGAPLPCAVLDGSGQQSLPIDVSPWGIARFDVTQQDWPRQFHGWLEQARQAPARL